MEVTTTVVNNNNKKVKITVCNGYFLDRTALQSLTVEEQRDIIPDCIECLEDYINNAEYGVKKAKSLNDDVYQLLSNKTFRATLKNTWEKVIEEKNKNRKRKLSEDKKFEIKNSIILEARDYTVGNVGLWTERDFWNVGKELNSTDRKSVV